MHRSVMEFGRRMLTLERVTDKNILELGSANINGSLRPIVENLSPASYTGIDITEGPGVDIVGDLEKLPEHIPEHSYDGIVCTEVFEHLGRWWRVINHMAYALKDTGWILLTARGYGYPKHEWPKDNWRYSVGDVYCMFYGCGDVCVWNDTHRHGFHAWIDFDRKMHSKGFYIYTDFPIFNVNENRMLSPGEWERIYGAD